MGMFIVLLAVFALILAATCGFFGIPLPESKPEQENDNESCGGLDVMFAEMEKNYEIYEEERYNKRNRR